MGGVSATLTLGSNVTVAGQLISLPSGNGPTITGTGVTLTAGGADVTALSGSTALIFNGVPLVLSGGNLAALSRVTFQNQNPTGTALTVNHVGQPAAFLFGELNFTTALSAGGFHLVANDLDGATPNPLTINLLSSTPASGAGVSQANNGAVINWPPAAPVATWTGAVSGDWNTAGNWSSGSVPTSANDVVIPALTPAVTVSGACAAKSLLVDGQLGLGSSNCQVQGDVTANGIISGTTGQVQVQATGQIRGNFPNIAVSAPVTLAGPVGVGSGNGNVTITGAGASLTLNGNTLASPGSLAVLNGGVVVMTNPADLLSFTGSVTFDGGDETGLLTAGQLAFAGDFTQAATSSPASFFAGGNHTTVVGGLGNASFTFATPASSRFQNLDLTQFGSSTLALGSNVHHRRPADRHPDRGERSDHHRHRHAHRRRRRRHGPQRLHRPHLRRRAAAALRRDHRRLQPSDLPEPEPGWHRPDGEKCGPGNAVHLWRTPVHDIARRGGSTSWPTTSMAPRPTRSPSTCSRRTRPRAPGSARPSTARSSTGRRPAAASPGTARPDQDWFDPANWDLNAVPGVIDDVILVPITNQPVLTTNAGINNLTSTVGSILDLTGFVLAAGGFADLAGTINDGMGGGGVAWPAAVARRSAAR